MTSKCGKNKKSGTRGVAECVTGVLTTFWRLLWSITESDAQQHEIYLFYIITKSLFISKHFNITQRRAFCPAFAPPLQDKKPFDVIYDLYKRKQSDWLLCVAKNCDWSRKIAPLSNLTRASLLEWILKKMQEKSSQFLSSEQPCEPKSLDVALKITRVEKNTLWKLVVTVNLEAIWFEFWMEGA